MLVAMVRPQLRLFYERPPQSGKREQFLILAEKRAWIFGDT
jgi:hypothetical protein